MRNEAQGVKLTEKQFAALRRAYRESGGKAYEPRNITGPSVKLAIAAGYVRLVDGRCGFERLKDAMLDWTDAGRKALETSNGN